MTCHIKATITYNWPITVTKDEEVLFQSEGTPMTYIGEHKYELDTGFSGTQVIRIQETPAPVQS